ncbi:MAG TPA: sterol carrier protein domain-containing protein [Mycobacteriales bacterium]|nr:sterol carrier protein domain-containing protein [Mycobacteriales bacterium]
MDNLWLRLVDVPAALRPRSYASPGHVVLEVTDELCGWNSGRWALTVAADGVTCEATSSEPDLRLGVAEVGAVYLGGSGLRAFAAAGRVHELTAGSIDLADRVYTWSPLPCCPEVF